MEVSILSVILFSVASYPSLKILGFLWFLKTFEIFIYISLDKIKIELMQLQSDKVLSRTQIEIVLRIMFFYQKVFEVVTKFNETFGFQLTMMMSAFTVTAVLQVFLQNLSEYR